MNEAAIDLQNRVTFVKPNLDENEETPMTYGVQAMPTLLLFKNGNRVANCIGARAKRRIVSWINEHV